MSSPADPAPDSPGEVAPGLGPRPSAAPSVGPRGSRHRNTVVLLAIAALYSLINAGILLVVGFHLAWILATEEVAPSFIAVPLLCALAAGAHWGLFAVLRHADFPRPKATANLLTVSVVLLFGQTALFSFVLDAGTFLSVPGAAFLQGVVIAVVLAMSRRRAFTWACVVVCVFLLLRSLTSLGLATLDAHQERQRDLEAIADYPYEIAVLDAPGWEPELIDTSHGDERIVLFYENADGDGMLLTTWGTYAPEVDPDRPLWAWCEDHGRECVESPEGIVLSESDEGVRAPDVARVEVAPGRVAVLEQEQGQIPGSLRRHRLPDVSLDVLHELATQVRAAEEGEVEDLVEQTG